VIDGVVGAYIFTNTTREKSPSWSYDGVNIELFEVSWGGEVIVYGSGTEIFYLEFGDRDPLWRFSLDSEITQLSVSANGKFVTATDENNTVYLVFRGTKNNPNLVFKYKIDKEIKNVYLYGIGEYFYVLRLVVATEESFYVFSLNQEEPLWTYTLDDELAVGEVPYNGKIIVLGTKTGGLYTFLTFGEELTQERHRDSPITSISVSPYSESILVGCEDGTAFMITSAGDTVWEHEYNSEIVFTSTSIKGRYSLLKTEGGEILFLNEKGETIRMIRDREATPLFSPWTSDFILINGTNVTFYNKDRDAPMWRYSGNNPPLAVRSTIPFDTFFLVYENKFSVITKDSIFLLGSRRMWSLLTALFIIQVLGYFYLSQRERIHIRQFVRSDEFKILATSTVLGGTLGSLFGYIYMNPYLSEIIFLSTAISVLATWSYITSERGLSGLLISWVYAIFASIILGAFSGVVIWLGGIETSIFSSLGVHTFIGGFIGIIVGLIVAIVAAVVCSLYK
jgi:hypothetical protein